MPQEFSILFEDARRDILDRMSLPQSDRKFIEREVQNFIDEWFNGRRVREWKEAGVSATALPAMFAVVTHCLNAMTQGGDSCSR